MKIILGFSCLVALAVIAGVTSAPEQELEIEDQIADFDEDHLERKASGCGTKRLCTVAGGQCQPLTEECDGVLRANQFYCKNKKDCGCCIPPGCVYDGKAYADDAIITVGCIKLHCSNGNLTTDLSGCLDSLCKGCGIPCTCTIRKGFGCTLGAPNMPGKACRCELDGPITNPNTKCVGTVESCNNQALDSCKLPGTSYEHCLQGLFGSHGNCCGYLEADCRP